MSQVSPLLRVMSSSVAVANRAGKIIRDIMSQGDLGIVEKGKDDLQTEADRSAQRCIVASLSQLFPKISVIGEEGTSDLKVPSDWLISSGCPELLSSKCPSEFESVQEEDIVVWVDPLDGTSEYTQGFLDHVTVLIGVAVNKEAVGGIIHQPYYNVNSSSEVGRTIWGLQGLGVGGMEVQPPPAEKFIVTTTRSHSNALVISALDAIKPDEVLRVGGAGYKVLQLLEGKANAYVFASAGCKRWDTCAPEAVLHAAGGCLTDIEGQKYSYGADESFPNTKGVLATPKGVDHWVLVNTIPDTVKQTLCSNIGKL